MVGEWYSGKHLGRKFPWIETNPTYTTTNGEWVDILQMTLALHGA
jgi:hypothetical protein